MFITSTYTTRSVADPGFAKRGADHGERAEREPKWGSGGRPVSRRRDLCKPAAGRENCG